MRITFIMPADDLTGGNRVVATYARLLQARGHRVQVVCNAPDRPGWRQRLRLLRRGAWQQACRPAGAAPSGHVSRAGVPFHVLECPRPVRAADLPDADVLVASWWETARWMQDMPASKGRKVHLLQGYETWGGGDVRRQVQDTLRLPNCKIAISESLKREIEADLGSLGMFVVPNAVDLQLFDAPPRQRGTPPVVGFIYAGSPVKGSDRCRQAIELARRDLPELRALAFGADQPAADWPLPADCRFVYRPEQTRLAALYARCDVWLFASRQDSFGLPILEAMACRTPVVGVSVGAAPELLTVDTGCLVADGPDAMLTAGLAAGVVRLCSQPPEQWCRMSGQAHARAHAYSWDDATDRLLQVLETLHD
ncbi:glycosyltransferase family 4 protein [Laribacter hongkongensis]|uniref:glycosyltransferase family 4 protein n=1 Tax=Laribacter hongkongensis TaxID=168471 RepID=UPI001EFD74C7|nr:glycosyltransferase family 4 protein [Laribacter hongkongensis]MCG9083984.1 glycosyltransferase family 4 protein [Laribacter hongkongensis]